jgi:hypothetical protein
VLPKKAAARVKFAKLVVTAVEERCVPANYTWVGPDGGFASQAVNWHEDGQGPGVVPANPPGAQDQAKFDGNVANTAAVFDLAEVKNLILSPSYTKSIEMTRGALGGAPPMPATRINSLLQIDGGEMKGKIGAYFSTVNVYGTGSQFNWNAGKLTKIELHLGQSDVAGTAVTGTIDGANVKTLDTAWISNNRGTMTWKGAGNIEFPANKLGSISNTSNATFDIQSDASMNGGIGNSLNNYGTLKKSQGAGITEIKWDFSNYGTFQLIAGTVKLAGNSSAQTTGTTRLMGGNLAGSYDINSGIFDGVGTFTGNLRHAAGSIRAGLGGAPGNITIIGNYTQTTPGATIVVDINAAGVYSTLTVQANQGTGGAATLAGGQVQVNRDPGYTPGLGTTLAFLTYASVSGELNLSSTDQWFPPGSPAPMRFDLEKTGTSYNLVVEQAD